LSLVVVDELDGLRFQVAESVGLGERRHPRRTVFFFGNVESLKRNIIKNLAHFEDEILKRLLF
jgi:hypothetical protein